MRLRRNLYVASISVLTPVLALVVVGILVLVFGRETVDTTFGILILAFCSALFVGAFILVLSLKRASDLSQLQLDLSCGDRNTGLPEGRWIPDTWPCEE